MARSPARDPAVDAVLRRVPTQARAAEKVDRAIAAAQVLLEREGIGALSLTRVADEASVSAGALYQYLPDRDAIVSALSASYHARHEATMDALVRELTGAPGPDPVGAVVAAIARLYREHAGTRALRAGLTTATDREQTRAHKTRMVAKVHGLLVAVGLAAPGDDDTVARVVFFAADGVMHEAFSGDGDGDRALLEQLEVLLRTYLGAGPGARR